MNPPHHSNSLETPSVMGEVAVTHCSVGHSSKKLIEGARGYPESLARPRRQYSHIPSSRNHIPYPITQFMVAITFV